MSGIVSRQFGKFTAIFAFVSKPPGKLSLWPGLHIAYGVTGNMDWLAS
jgi:hypothetical protein